SSSWRRSLKGVCAHLAGADTDDSLDRGDPNLAVTDLAGARGFHDCVSDPLRVAVLDQYLDADLGHELHGVLGTTVDLGVAALAAEAAGLRHRDARDAERLERLADVVELERLDDGGDEPHSGLPKSRSVTGGGGGALAGSWPTNAGAGPEDCSIGGPVVGAWPPVLVVASTKSG